jgi:hypothetical protein
MGGNTPIADVPDGAVVGSVTDAFDGTATVAATAAATGGTPTTFTITPTPTTSPATFTGTSPVAVSGLSDGTSYTFTAAGVNSTATGPAGSSSSSFTPFVSGSFFSIATTTVGAGGASSVTFSSIPQTYTHLQIRGISNSADASYVAAQFNGDTGTSYSNHAIFGDGSAVVGQANVTTSNVQIARSNYFAASNSMFGVGICDILDYTNTNKFTTTRALAGNDTNGTAGGAVLFSSGNWRNTAAVTSISIFPTSGNFRQYSSFALYGVIA